MIIGSCKSLTDKDFCFWSAKEPQRNCEGTATKLRENRNETAKKPQSKCERTAIISGTSAKESQSGNPCCEETAMNAGFSAKEPQ